MLTQAKPRVLQEMFCGFPVLEYAPDAAEEALEYATDRGLEIDWDDQITTTYGWFRAPIVAQWSDYNTANNLTELFDMMISDPGEDPDWSDLPVFSDCIPSIPRGMTIWSWDDRRVIVGRCRDELCIIESASGK